MHSAQPSAAAALAAWSWMPAASRAKTTMLLPLLLTWHCTPAAAHLLVAGDDAPAAQIRSSTSGCGRPLSPQPAKRFEVIAYYVVLGPYGASTKDWEQTYDFSAMTAVVAMSPVSSNFTCSAHTAGVRVLDWTTIAGLPHNPYNYPETMTNITRRTEWARASAQLIHDLGHDGAALDIEGIETHVALLQTDLEKAAMRTGVVATVCALRRELDALIPGALLTINTNWFAPSQGGRVGAVYDYIGLTECTDFLHPMAYCYSAPGAPHGMRQAAACAPQPALRDGLTAYIQKGVTRAQLAPLLPWVGEQFRCTLDPMEHGGLRNAYNCTTTAATAAQIPQPGYVSQGLENPISSLWCSACTSLYSNRSALGHLTLANDRARR